MIDVTTFKARYEEFDDVSDKVVTTHIEESKSLLSEDKIGSKYEMLLFLLVAHELMLKDSHNSDAGIEVSRSTEGGSRTIKNIATTDNQLYYSSTSYGRKYLAIKRTVRFAGAVLCD